MSLSERKRSDKSDGSDGSDGSRASGLLPPHGGYRKLRSFQTSELVYDGTVIFCDRFINIRSRTHDQMVQAARSGRQNIAEGSVASGTSKKFELKLTSVAKASLEELLLDYEDFLRQRGLKLWGKDSPEAMAVRGRYRAGRSDKSDWSDKSDGADPYDLVTTGAEVAANTLICLINQATYLLKRQIQKLERDFLGEGGFTERLYRKRSEARRLSDKSDWSDGSDNAPRPNCPRCGKPMVRRTARVGANAGQSFWGCSAYPDCTGTRSIEQPDPGA